MAEPHASLAPGYVPGSGGSHASALPELRRCGLYLCDENGRIALPNGTGFANCKLPQGKPSHCAADEFFRRDDITYVGRPFPLDEADEHLGRLASWGLRLLRLVVVWEALEHAGPGRYDDAFIAYVVALVARMHAFGMRCTIDVHQDVFSRFAGGSGAPAWTFDVAGIDVTKLHASGAAIIHSQATPSEAAAITRTWPSNQAKFASTTMQTLFWAGALHAPRCTVPRSAHADPTLFADLDDDVNIQVFFQRSLIAGFGRLADALATSPAVLGFEPCVVSRCPETDACRCNEPCRGFVRLVNPRRWNNREELHIGLVPGPLESMALASGYPLRIERFIKFDLVPPSRRAGRELVTPPENGVWLPGRSCPWREHGVWDFDEHAKTPRWLRNGAKPATRWS